MLKLWMEGYVNKRASILPSIIGPDTGGRTDTSLPGLEFREVQKSTDPGPYGTLARTYMGGLDSPQTINTDRMQCCNRAAARGHRDGSTAPDERAWHPAPFFEKKIK
jgi:hypothetical protein